MAGINEHSSSGPQPQEIPASSQNSNLSDTHDQQPPQPSVEGVAAGTRDDAAAEEAVGQASGTTEGQATGNAQRRLTFKVWNHFKRQKINGLDKAICKKHLSGVSKNGTKHLHDHYKICLARRNQYIGQSILNPRQEKLNGPVSLGAHTFDQNVSREELAKMIILHEYPLNMVEHVGFRSFVNSINPLFKHVSRTTITTDIKGIFESEKAKLKKVLNSNQGRVAVTTDMWTASNQKRGYMVVTAHYIDDSWNLRNQILRFMYVPAPRNAKTLAKELMGCLITWSIDCKLSTLTLDNCSVNISMMDKMKEKLRHS